VAALVFVFAQLLVDFEFEFLSLAFREVEVSRQRRRSPLKLPLLKARTRECQRLSTAASTSSWQVQELLLHQ
jgi:hypothetical protein